MRLFGFLCSVLMIMAQADALQIVVRPYLNSPAQDSMVVRWETDEPSSSTVEYSETQPLSSIAVSEGDAVYHEVKLTGLRAGTPYFYRVVSKNTAGESAVGDIYGFRTAVEADRPFSFVVFCDTQANPEKMKKLSENAYSQRPCFTLIGGDLVTDGNVKGHWTEHFFPNMEALNHWVPVVPILGNHENNAKFFYDYFTLPEPEYFYRFTYGNLDVFMLDSQKPMEPGSEQHNWLAKELEASSASWKIVMFHKPPYSSDDDDYGDTYKEKSTCGELDKRVIVPLMEQYKVDIVWNGHIHTYERTWPLLNGKPVAEGEGPVYLITGGGGGGLENAAPTRNDFTAKIYRGHHYCYVSVNSNTMRIEAYDIDNTLFDFVELKK